MEILPLNAIRAFAKVYETGGIRSAARLLSISHSSISRHVRELESWLGVDLVQHGKSARSLAFTVQGETLGKAALKSLGDLETVTRSLRERRPGNAVTISTTPSFASRWLLPRLDDFTTQFPWIELSVNVDQKLTDFSDQSADFAIRMGNGPWQDFECEPLMDDALAPVMSPDYWKTINKTAHKAVSGNEQCRGLSEAALLHDRDPNTAWDHWRTSHGPTAMDSRTGPRFASSDLVLRAAAQGLGVALARLRLASDDLSLGVLIRPFGDRNIAMPKAYWIVSPLGQPRRIAVTHAIQWLKIQVESTPWPESSAETGL